jgi:hypothetical protein
MPLSIKLPLGTWDLPFMEVVITNPVTRFERNITAILDTGAAECLIQKHIAAELGIHPITSNEFNHPKYGNVKSVGYFMHITLLSEHGSCQLKNFPLGEFENESYPADVILGGTLLKSLKLIYDGPNNLFEVHIK